MKRLEDLRLARQIVYEHLFGAKALCIAGLVIMPAMLFNPHVESRIFHFLFFWFLAWLSGKKNNPLFTILVILGITGFNLIVPYGRVLFSIGEFRITAGALEAGIKRAATLEGLIMLSRVTIRQDLKIPGPFGELIGESFRMFALIMNRAPRLIAHGNANGSGKNIFVGISRGIGRNIDRLMLELSGDEEAGQEVLDETAGGEIAGNNARTMPGTKPAGFVIIAVTVMLSWLSWLLG